MVGLPDLPLCGGHSAFADQRIAFNLAEIGIRENSLLCPSSAKNAEIAGKLEGLWF